MIKRHHPPVNILGGYKFPDAPVIDLSPGSSNDGVAPQSDNVTIPSPANSAPRHLLDQIPDDLSIPAFLRRQPPQAPDRKEVA